MYWTKFLHLLFGVSFFGAYIASFFYVLKSDHGDGMMRKFTVRHAIRIDRYVFMPMAVVALMTGLLMVHFKYYTYTTPWIVAAYTFLTLIILSIYSSVKIKRHRKKFIILNSIVIFLLIVIIHDAVMKHTLLGHFL